MTFLKSFLPKEIMGWTSGNNRNLMCKCIWVDLQAHFKNDKFILQKRLKKKCCPTSRLAIGNRKQTCFFSPQVTIFMIHAASNQMVALDWCLQIVMLVNSQITVNALQKIWAPSRENLFMTYANNKALISTFAIHCLDSIMLILVKFKISRP